MLDSRWGNSLGTNKYTRKFSYENRSKIILFNVLFLSAKVLTSYQDNTETMI